jgi:hypothetical protein
MGGGQPSPPLSPLLAPSSRATAAFAACDDLDGVAAIANELDRERSQEHVVAAVHQLTLANAFAEARSLAHAQPAAFRRRGKRHGAARSRGRSKMRSTSDASTRSVALALIEAGDERDALLMTRRINSPDERFKVLLAWLETHHGAPD